MKLQTSGNRYIQLPYAHMFTVACQVFDSYIRYLSYALSVITEMPNYELTGNHTLSLPPLYL